MVFSNVDIPEDLKALSIAELEQLCEELRQFLNEGQYGKSGHIRASMGVTELSVALHHLLQTPDDILLWDVGHQAYVHKLLTGRKKNFASNRQYGGLAGFTSRQESVYDPFGAGHSSTSISALCGFARAASLKGVTRKHVAVIGDGALTAGLAFEAMNYAGDQELDILVVLNDNQQSIDANVGALGKYGHYESLCEALNFDYLGSVDGHDMQALVPALSKAVTQKGPRLLRVSTQKGKGYQVPSTQKQEVATRSWQDIAGESLCQLAEEDENVVLISPAMLSGGGFNDFARRFPERTFDVGIAEQHAVTFAAGLAASGMKPYVHLYSTFSQRALDQIIHDVALQNLPVVFLLDRAGLVGEDGATHHGSFDQSLLSSIPNVCLQAPSDEEAFKSLLKESVSHDGPLALRYPKQSAELDFRGNDFYREGNEKLVISYGNLASAAEHAAKKHGYGHLVLQQMKPLPWDRIQSKLSHYTKLITVEENTVIGGFGDLLALHLQEHGAALPITQLGLPDRFIEHSSRTHLLEILGLTPEGLAEAFLSA